MNKYINILSPFLFIVFFLFSSLLESNQSLIAQTVVSNNDLTIAKKKFTNGEYNECIKILLKKIEVLEKEKSPLTKRVDYLFLLGKTYQQKENPEEYLALKYLLQSLKIYTNIGNYEKIAQNTYLLALLYEKWKTFPKAIEYYSLSFKFTELEKEQILNLEGLGRCYIQNKSYTEASNTYKVLISIYEDTDDKINLKTTYNFLFLISQKQGHYKKMLDYKRDILLLNELLYDSIDLVNTYNNIGYIYQQLKKPEKAIRNFDEAILLNNNIRQIDKNEQKKKNLIININKAFSLHTQGNDKEALVIYKNTLNKALKLGDTSHIAKSYNFLGTHYYITNNSNKAIEYLFEATKIGEKATKNPEIEQILGNSYKALSEIYQARKNFKESQEFYKKYLDLISKLEKKETTIKQENLQQQLNIEKEESKFEMLIADQEQKQLAYEKLLLKTEKIQTEKNLEINYLKTKHLEQTQKSQALKLKHEKFTNEQIQQNLKVLEKEQQVQYLQLQQKELEEKERRKEIEQLQKDRKFKEQLILDEEELQKYTLGLVILCITIIFIMGIAFINKQRLAKELTQQHKEIEYKRIELDKKNHALLNSQDVLQQKMSELEVQQRIIKTQKIILERTNNELKVKDDRFTHSLKYAERIQQAILPLTSQFLNAFDDFFVIFKPKDLVSGDFYWHTTIKNKHIIAIVDCTGHGVPGAFMSMIGNTLLKQIVNEQKITQPNKIISLLHKNICKALNQESSNSIDGMDIGISSIEENNNKFSIEFSGAKNNLFYFHQDEIHTIMGERLSIGGKSHLKNDQENFENHTFLLHKGDTLYFLTDGIIDAANFDRKRFGSKNIKKVLIQNHHLKMEEQESFLTKALTDHQQDTEQRDDITVLGIKL